MVTRVVLHGRTGLLCEAPMPCAINTNIQVVPTGVCILTSGYFPNITDDDGQVMAWYANERNVADTGSSDSENQDDGNSRNAAKSDSDNSGGAGEDELPYDKLKEALDVKKLDVPKLSDEVVSLEEHLSDHIETIEADLARKK